MKKVLDCPQGNHKEWHDTGYDARWCLACDLWQYKEPGAAWATPSKLPAEPEQSVELQDTITKLTWANREFLRQNNELQDKLETSWARNQELHDRADYLQGVLGTLNGPHWEMML